MPAFKPMTSMACCRRRCFIALNSPDRKLEPLDKSFSQALIHAATLAGQ
jgi:hypothetical protein